jgi:hypothetical protein
MSENLSNQFWQVLTSVLAVISIILSFVTVILAYKNRRRKGLSYSTSSTAVLPKVQGTVGERLQIQFDGKPVQQIFLNTVTLLCSGNETIKSDDYKAIEVVPDVRILSAEIVKPSPRCLDANLTFDEAYVRLEPVTMNHRDRIDMKILTGARPHNTVIRAHIAGVEEMKEINRHEKLNYWAGLTGTALMIGAAALSGYALLVHSDYSYWLLIGFIILASIGLPLFTMSMLLTRPES